MRKLLSLLLNIAAYAAIVAAIVWGVPKFLAWQFGTNVPIAAITSGSMWPALKTGDLILIRAVAKDDIAVGDIVVWRNGPGFVTHRVKELNADTLVTKGDANFEDDPPVGYDALVGKTVSFWGGRPFRIPWIGNISVWAGQFRGGNTGTTMPLPEKTNEH